MKRIADALFRQLRLNRHKNMLFAAMSSTLEIDPTFLAALEEASTADCKKLDSGAVNHLVGSVVKSVIDRIISINQFVQIDQSAKDSLSAIYRNTWARILAGNDIEMILRNYHYPLISSWIAERYPPMFRARLSSEPTIGKVVCQEYSAEFQIELYGLNASAIVAPLLDVGCGKNALLVSYLRQRGIESYGIDRSLARSDGHLEVRDWLEIDDSPAKWGTIVSNMAFTNHCLYIQAHEPGRLPVYRERYLSILESLKEHGSFHYGPSVPKLERMIDPKRFRIEIRMMNRAFGIAKVTKVAP